MRLHRPRKACRILHVADQAYDGHSWKSREELLLDLVKAELVRFEENQPLRSELCKLPAKLGADRASGARDQRRSTPQPLAQAGAVEPHRIAAEQVIELDGAKLGVTDPAGHQVLVGRDRHRTDSSSAAQLQRTPPGGVRRARHGDDGLLDPEARGDLRKGLQRTQHLHSVDIAALPRRVVVEESDERPLRATAQALQQIRARDAGAEHDHALGAVGGEPCQAALLPGPVGDAAAAHQSGEKDRIEDHDRTRNISALQQQHQHRDGERSQSGRHQDAPQVGEARVAP